MTSTGAENISVELIDSHCHLGYDYGRPIEELIAAAQASGVRAFVNVGIDVALIPQLEEISQRFPQVFHTVGVHPHEAKTLDQAGIEALRKGAKHPKCVAIGEIGLDYYYEHSDPETQKIVLQQQLDLAAECDLPIVLHTRDAEEDQLPFLEKHAERVGKKFPPGVIHCFTGTRPFAEACVKLGYSISFSGILTFKTAEDLRKTAAALPLDRILVETDSPYLAPIPMRGKKCEPAYMKFTAEKLAEIKGISLEALAAATAKNTLRAFPRLQLGKY